MPLHHNIVHLRLYLSDLELEMTLLMLVTFNKLVFHRFKLFLGTHQLFCKLLSQSLLPLQGCCHLIVDFFEFCALFSQILIDPFQLFDDDHVFIGVSALHLDILKLVLVVDELGLLLEQLVFHLLVLTLQLLQSWPHLLRLLLLRLVFLGTVRQLVPQLIKVKGQFPILILCLAVQYLLLLHVIPDLPVVLLEFIELGENLILFTLQLVALIDCRIELVQQYKFLIVDSAVPFGLPGPDLRNQSLVLPLLVAQLLPEFVYLLQKGPVLPLTLWITFGIADWAKAKPQWLIVLHELRFLWTVALHFDVVHPLQWRLQLLFQLAWPHDWHHFFSS